VLLAHLETFAKVAERLSFTRAAVELNLSQPAVTQHVAALEEALDCKLLERGGRTVALTSAGEKVLAAHRRIQSALAELRHELAGIRGGSAGRIAVGAGLTICIFTLPELLAEYRRMHPAVEVHLRSGRTQEVLNMVLGDQVDVGLVTSPVRHRLVETVPLYRDRMVVIAPPDHPLACAQGPADPAALAGQRLILFERGSGFRAYLEELFESRGVLLQPDMELDSIEAIKEMVLAGLGVSVVPEMAVRRELASGSLVSVELGRWPRMERTTSLIVRRGQPGRPAVQAFAELVRGYYGKDPLPARSDAPDP
jgi:DNA-binding transcriptional LysR family regulator